MARQKFEFICTECHKYFDFMMNTSLNGNYRIHCPNCGHVHYRSVEKGAITDKRFTDAPDKDNVYIIEDIKPMKASCRDYQREKPVPPDRQFMHDLWEEHFSARA